AVHLQRAQHDQGRDHREHRGDRMRQRLLLAAAVLPAALVLGRTVRAVDPPRPPDTRTAETSDTLHGVAIADPYRWLEDQAAPETRAWIDAQNAYTESVIGAQPGKERIERRLAELIKVEQVTVHPVPAGLYSYTRRAPDQVQ